MRRAGRRIAANQHRDGSRRLAVFLAVFNAMRGHVIPWGKCRHCTVLRRSRLTGDPAPARRASPTHKFSRRGHPGQTIASTTYAATHSVGPVRAGARRRSARHTPRLRPRSQPRPAAEPDGRPRSEGHAGPARTAATVVPMPVGETGETRKPQRSSHASPQSSVGRQRADPEHSAPRSVRRRSSVPTTGRLRRAGRWVESNQIEERLSCFAILLAIPDESHGHGSPPGKDAASGPCAVHQHLGVPRTQSAESQARERSKSCRPRGAAGTCRRFARSPRDRPEILLAQQRSPVSDRQ